MPSRTASAASIGSPSMLSSLALGRPTMSCSRSSAKPGSKPSWISGTPKRARSEARMKSQAIASSKPPPNATPLTAAISGLRQRSGASSTGSTSAMKLRACSGVAGKVLMSAPAQKALSPRPVRMPTRISSSAWILARLSITPSRMPMEMALSLVGSSNVTIATRPCFSNSTLPMRMDCSCEGFKALVGSAYQD
jgi:hypothetical protein